MNFQTKYNFLCQDPFNKKFMEKLENQFILFLTTDGVWLLIEQNKAKQKMAPKIFFFEKEEKKSFACDFLNEWMKEKVDVVCI